MINKRVEAARKIGTSLSTIIWFSIPFSFFVFTDDLLNEAIAYWIGVGWVVLYFMVVLWFLDGEEETSDDEDH